MVFFSFGKKRKSTRRKSVKKPPAAILKRCRKLKIKTTKKVGSRRVYRSLSLLRKLIKKKSKKIKKAKKSKRSKKAKRRSRFGSVKSKFSFGSGAYFSNAGPAGYGYNQPVVQNYGILPQSSQIVTAESNFERPMGSQLPEKDIPNYGVARPFFTENIPTQVGPKYTGMRQSDGSIYNIGGPFVGYRTPAYGQRRRRN
jgi:hypothetical protein